MSSIYARSVSIEPNHRQELALERMEFAVGELSTVLLSIARSHDAARGAIAAVRKAVVPVVADILATD
jgi:hypothetical protein